MELQLSEIMLEEYEMLKSLYEALIEQNKYLVERQVFLLDKIVKVIEERSRNVARLEVERRKITGDRPMREIIKESEDKKLEKVYLDIVNLLGKMKFQKDTNEALVKQWLGFANQMLRALNPNKQSKTYNAFGRSR
ncbi:MULTISPECIES: flagellar export chaperone FlgN [Clostridium]|uniref:FlgN protein n=2 Tax=Clostridium TaxID=1485 RepID=D8GPV9_CLOLD|nr:MULTISPECIES: flagellar export chaperone FlgN [Clostridium]ADK14018.1 conserved hypothetical protein [Clostridium ljungdahlii DSM 13528]AGY77248.1 flagellar protein FlgN [Clostridium autoethanogenum DSM 10061]ALU37390.1 FlgN family protein [Clostridium autoethanogenum DSM 10061]OAA87509.1 FlgN protein [Clostridium ljungdahlii DSM 13528]OVY50042.1 FlgN protein [Clostridium autoethanogenum]